MSEGETVRDRIEAVRMATPPPEGRRARKGYISKEDFAELIGVTRSRVFAWTRPDRPEFPEEQHRRRLAELSGGRYAPEDFASELSRSRSQPSLADIEANQARALVLLQSLEATAASMAKAIDNLTGAVAALHTRLEEHQHEQPEGHSRSRGRRRAS